MQVYFIPLTVVVALCLLHLVPALTVAAFAGAIPNNETAIRTANALRMFRSYLLTTTFITRVAGKRVSVPANPQVMEHVPTLIIRTVARVKIPPVRSSASTAWTEQMSGVVETALMM
jgi:hypothetical protein